MFSRKTRIERSFTASVNDLVFQVHKNHLTIGDLYGRFLATSVTASDMETLIFFCQKAMNVLSPTPGNTVVYENDVGPQRLTLLKDEKNNHILIINDQIQFTTNSEEIYHEALVGPITCSVKDDPKKFLILGGGDGLVAKQIFKENPEAKITLVDFDKNITDLFLLDPVMKEINEDSMTKCDIKNEDAFVFAQTHTEKYDIIICDFPDPDDIIFSKLYSLEFYLSLIPLLNEGGGLAVQSGSLIKESKCFNCIKKTLEAAGFKTKTFYTPTSFGDLVYTIGKLDEVPMPDFSKSKRKYNTLSQEFFEKAMSTFRPGVWSKQEVEVNTVENNVALVYRMEEVG
jgi:spermidine synthase